MVAGTNMGTITVSINANVAGALAGLKQMDKALNRFGKQTGDATKGATKNLSQFQKFIGQIAHYISFTIGVQMVLSIRRGFESLIETFKEFERAITDAVAVSGYLGSAFDKAREDVGNLARELSRETVFSVVEVAKAMYDLASAGLDITKVTKNELLPILEYAAATQSDLKEATNATLVAMKAFRLELEDTEMIVDTFTSAITSSFLTMEKLRDSMRYVAPIAGVLGVSLQETVAAVAMLTEVGFQGAQAGQRLNMVFNRLLRPTEKSRQMLESMGLTMRDLDPNVYSLVEILYKLQAAGFGAAEAAHMFRARTAGAAVVLVENVESIARMIASYKQAEGVTHSVAEAQKDTLWAAFKQAGNAIGEAATRIGEELRPLLIEIANFSKSVLVPIMEVFGKVLLILGQALMFIVSNLKILLPLYIAYSLITKRGIVYTKLASAVTWLLGKAKIFLGGATHFATQALLYYNATLMVVSGALGKAAGAAVGFGAALLTTPVGWLALFAAGLVGIAFGFDYFSKKSVRSKASLKDFRIQIAESREDLTKYQRTFLDLLAVYDLSELKAGTRFEEAFPSRPKAAKFAEDFFREMKTHASDYVEFWEAIARRHTEVGKEIGGRTALEIFQKEGVEGLKNVIPSVQSIWDVFTDVIEESGFTILTTSAAIKHISGEYFGFTAAIKTAVEALEEQKTTEEELDKIRKEYPDDINKIREATENYTLAREKAIEAETNWMRSLGSLITEIRAFDDEAYKGTLDEWIDVLESSAKAQGDLTSAQSKLTRLMTSEDIAVTELSRALALWGADSDEATAAQNRLNDIITRRGETLTDIEEIQGEISSNETLIAAVLSDRVDEEKRLSSTEKDLLKTADSLIDMRQDYITTQSEVLRLEAKLNAIEYAREEHLTILEGKLKIFLEAQQKVFEIEEKLYKLREEEDEQLDTIFQKLADQGIVTQEMIEGYVELMEAQAEVMALTHDFVDLYSGLTEEQKEIVDAFMRGEASIADLEAAGIQGIGMIVAYRDAQERLNVAIGDFGDLLGPLLRDLMDMGILTSDVVQAFYDWIDNANEAAQSNFALLETHNKLTETMEGLIRTTTLLAKSLVVDEADTLRSTFDDLLVEMGLFERSAATEGAILNWLKGLYQRSAQSLDEFTEEELIVAATLVDVAQKLHLYEAGMTAADIATSLGVQSITDLNNMASVSLTTFDSYHKISEDLTIATNNFTDATDALVESITKLRIFMGFGDDALRDYALRFDFADTLIKGFKGDAMALMTYMASHGWDFDVSVMTNWDGEDWDAFFSSLSTTQKGEFIEAVSEMSGESVDTITNWDGEDWSTFMTTTNSNLDSLQQAFIDSGLYIPVEVKIDEPRNVPNYDPQEARDKEGKGIPKLPVNTELNPPPQPSWLEQLFRIGGQIIKRFIWPWEAGGIAGLASGGLAGLKRGAAMVKGPIPALIGEAGPEAVIPLTGGNRKYGKELLNYIIPRYYPELMRQAGGLFGPTTNITNAGGTYATENFNIYGPINVTGTANAADVVNQLKYRSRMATR